MQRRAGKTRVLILRAAPKCYAFPLAPRKTASFSRLRPSFFLFPPATCNVQHSTSAVKKKKKRSREGPEVRRMLGFWAWDTTIALSKHMLSHLPCSNIKPETRRGGPGKWWGKIRGRKTQGKLGGKKRRRTQKQASHPVAGATKNYTQNCQGCVACRKAGGEHGGKVSGLGGKTNES